MLFLTTSVRYDVVGVYTFPRGGLFVISGFERFLFVTKNNSMANDKCIILMVLFKFLKTVNWLSSLIP